ncbi:chaplin [Streptomyces sp. NPDC002889]|uniref:chaplin n=1 Tax=Streptomyces sp. NPDC002889 TaxID=3364669 RepID=UPI00367E7947
MRQVHRKGLATVMLTGGALAMATGYAHANSNADGAASDSPGVLSGNTVQLPVNVPVNVCGNTANVVGVLNPAVGNQCANGSGAGAGSNSGSAANGGTAGSSTAGSASNGGGATADGGASNSPGVLSGNSVQLPIDVPVNVSGNSVNVVGIGNPATGNTSANVPGKPPAAAPATPPKAAHPPKSATDDEGPLSSGGSLAHTGSDQLAFAVPAGATLLLGGLVLYRRFRPAQESARV